jgi:hypothetical protein
MLFGYPIDATQENWLHEALLESLQCIHTAVIHQNRVPTKEEIISARYSNRLGRRRGLRDRLFTYGTAFRDLQPDERESVMRAVGAQNDIDNLLACRADCDLVQHLPLGIQGPAKDLFDFAFDLLSKMGIRDQQYRTIYEAIPGHVCPFCGCEPFDAPGARREALDHYLVASKYPFAGANLRNLVPMGYKCNSSYKRDQDVLRRADGGRRRVYDPYRHEGVETSLKDSRLFARDKQRLPDWEISFNPQTEEVETWDEVFHIRARYKRDVLDASYDRWLRIFAKWCKRSGFGLGSDDALAAALDRYATDLADSGLNDRSFLKAACFRMLYVHVQQRDRRLITFLQNAIRFAPN